MNYYKSDKVNSNYKADKADSNNKANKASRNKVNSLNSSAFLLLLGQEF